MSPRPRSRRPRASRRSRRPRSRNGGRSSRRRASRRSEAAHAMKPGAADALLFDLGGVIIDIDFNRVFARWAASAGCDPALLRERFTQDEPYRRHEIGAIGIEDYFA